MTSMEIGRPIRRVPRKLPQDAASLARAPELADMKPEDQCYFLHCKGYSGVQIGHILGIDRETATRRIKKVAARVRPTDEDRLSWVQESVDALQQVKTAAWTQFEQTGDPYLLAQVTAAEERIAKVRGLMNNNALVETDGNISITITGINPASRTA